MLRSTLTFNNANELPHARSGRNLTGFTLLELLIVLAVAGIMSAMAIPSMQSAINGYKLTAAVDSATWAIQSTRYQAIMHGYPYQIAFDATQNTFQVLSEPPVPTPPAFANIGTAVPLSGAPITFSTNTTLQFSPNGSVSATTGQMNFTITYQAYTKTVTVSNYGSTSVQ
jgi:prepilin-type N-terminal cleavage/methylation domain-containing protein